MKYYHYLMLIGFLLFAVLLAFRILSGPFAGGVSDAPLKEPSLVFTIAISFAVCIMLLGLALTFLNRNK